MHVPTRAYIYAGRLGQTEAHRQTDKQMQKICMHAYAYTHMQTETMTDKNT